MRRVTPDLAVELWPGDSLHIWLVATSYPVKIALTDLEALSSAIQDAVKALVQAEDVELGAEEPVIDQRGVLIDQDGVIIELGGTVIDQGETLECDICGQPAILVVDDDEHTTLCDNCCSGYFRELPSWTIEEYLERQRRQKTDQDG